MTAILLRIIIYVLIIGFVYFSARRIWRDFKAQFRGPDQPRPRDLRQPQQQQPVDVIDLKRGSDGVYRSPGDRER